MGTSSVEGFQPLYRTGEAEIRHQRENYNKPKSENAKQPKCPKEKEDTIVEALRHFQMI